MKSNRTPFTDVLKLITVTETPDADGYVEKTETASEVFCNISDGVNRNELYEAMKAGIQLKATAEIWEDDYNKEELAEHDDTRYRIIRIYPTGYGTLELSLEEVRR